jgi:hypothetical protein
VGGGVGWVDEWEGVGRVGVDVDVGSSVQVRKRGLGEGGG